MNMFNIKKGENMKIVNNISTCSLYVEQIQQNKEVA